MVINFAGHPLIVAACEAFYLIAHAINLHGIMILIFHLLESIIIHCFMRFKCFCLTKDIFLASIFFNILYLRARATNTQLGQEENSDYILLEVDTSLDMDVAPEIIVPPANITVARQKSVAELQCIANARPLHLLSLVWLKDGTPIEQSGIPYSFNDLWNRTLSLYSVDFVHDGVYTCQVRMRTGGPTLSAAAQVTVIGMWRKIGFLHDLIHQPERN